MPGMEILGRRHRSAPSAGSIGTVLDIPAARLLVRGAGRFVQPMHDDDPDGARFKTLVRGLQLSPTDIRFVMLRAGFDPAARARGNFLVELDACAGQPRIGAGR